MTNYIGHCKLKKNISVSVSTIGFCWIIGDKIEL